MVAAQDSELGDAMARLLIEHGAGIHRRSDDGYTALSVAACNGNIRCFNLLLEHGADPTACVTEVLLKIKEEKKKARRRMKE